MPPSPSAPSPRAPDTSGVTRLTRYDPIDCDRNMPDQPDDDPHAPTTVFESSDPALLAIAKTLLQDNKIYYFVAGEGLQELFVFGRYGTGFNPLVGPA